MSSSKPSLPFIYSDAFIVIAIIVMVVLAIISLVLIPLFVYKKTPNKYPRIVINNEDKLAELGEEEIKYFSSVKVESHYLVFKPQKDIINVRVAICFHIGHGKKVFYYDLDFSENDTIRINFPEKAYFVNFLQVVDENNRDLNGNLVESVKNYTLWIYAISVGVSAAASIFLVVLILSTHLRRVNNAFIAYYFLALLGGGLVPAIYFLLRKLVRKNEEGGKK